MIIYFSATGNTKYLAYTIAEGLGDKRIISIETLINKGIYNLELHKGESLGIMCPTYTFGLPEIVKKYMTSAKINKEWQGYSYFVTTYGSTYGCVCHFAKKYGRSMGIKFKGFFGVKMVDTWTPLFDVSDKKANKKIEKNFEPQVLEIYEKIERKMVVNLLGKGILTIFAPQAKLLYERLRKTNDFHVNDQCNGCKLCEKKCPSKAIALKDGKPVWIKEKCNACLRCLHLCPQNAISKKNSMKNGQYTNPNIKI